MKKIFSAVFVALILISLGSCSDNARKADAEIEEFEIGQIIKSADRNYRFIMAEDTTYVDIYTTIQWPTRLGGADITVLQDSLLRICYPDTSGLAVDAAIKAYLDDTMMFVDMADDGKVERVDSIPDGDEVRSYFSSVSAAATEITEDMATYQVTYASYLGGAHPYTSIYPFTYDLENSRVLTLGDILTQEGVDSIMPVIKNALARQLEVPVEQLGRAGIFMSQFDKPGKPYILGTVLYFHYNPYEIAPYSAGMIDVPVYPYELRSWLKPDVKKLFDTTL